MCSWALDVDFVWVLSFFLFALTMFYYFLFVLVIVQATLFHLRKH